MPREYELRPAPGQKPPQQAAELTDDSPMPFGKYSADRGDPRKMKDVPAQYYFWLWTECRKEKDMKCPVAAYIRKNLRSLAGEYTDGIW